MVLPSNRDRRSVHAAALQDLPLQLPVKRKQKSRQVEDQVQVTEPILSFSRSHRGQIRLQVPVQEVARSTSHVCHPVPIWTACCCHLRNLRMLTHCWTKCPVSTHPMRYL